MGGGFSIAEAQWLIQFFRRLPGSAPQQASEEEYQAAMEAQREEARSRATQAPPVQLAWGYGYEDPNY